MGQYEVDHVTDTGGEAWTQKRYYYSKCYTRYCLFLFCLGIRIYRFRFRFDITGQREFAIWNGEGVYVCQDTSTQREVGRHREAYQSRSYEGFTIARGGSVPHQKMLGMLLILERRSVVALFFFQRSDESRKVRG